ncbi:MAG TPA: preprotein translocase subunit SecG [Candidatus Acidoferrum sp.]|nr:preprotein translocase subunit SecG [Candidatus Acidoferrum sp.]
MPGHVKWAISLLIGAGLLYVGFKIPTILVVFHIIVCFMLAVVVLLQSGTSADLAGAFGGAGSQTAFGPRGAATFLSKATTWCAIMFMFSSLLLVGVRQEGTVTGRSVLEKFSKPAPTAPAPKVPQNPPPSTPQPNH